MSGIVTVEADALTAALKAVAPGVPRVTALPITQGVRLHTEDGRLHLETNGFDVACSTSLPASKASLDTIVNHRTLSSVAGKCSGALAVGVRDDQLVIETARRQVQLRCLTGGEWRPLPTVDVDPVELNDEQVAALARVGYAAGRDSNRVELTGVKITEGAAAATDSYRLATAAIAFGVDALIPATPFMPLVQLAKPMTLRADASYVAVEVEGTTTFMRLVQGDYPKVEALLKSKLACQLTVDRAALLEAVDFVTPVARDDEKKARVVRLSTEGDELVVAASAVDVGEASARIAVTGSIDFTAAFSDRFLRECLATIADDEVTLHLDTALQPMQVNDGITRHVIMPVRP